MSTQTRIDDRPAMVAREVDSLRRVVDNHSLDGITRLELRGGDGRLRAAMLGSARRAIQYAGGEPLELIDEVLECYGDPIPDEELRQRARSLGGQVLDALARGRAAAQARKALRLMVEAGVIREYREDELAAVARTILERSKGGRR